MNKKLLLGLQDFNPIPSTLQLKTDTRSHVAEVKVSLPALFHHRFIDTYNGQPPSKKILAGYHSHAFSPGPFLRATIDGLGSHKEARVAECNLWGKAFCRWFLHEHCGFNYFTHLDDILDKNTNHSCGNVTVCRATDGDTPDYLCRGFSGLALAEAKGTGKAISFSSAKFASWREQFDRVECRRRNGTKLSLKGFIVATRIVSEDDSDKVRSQILVEDPKTRGQSEPDDADESEIGSSIVAKHYSQLFEALRLPLFAAALRLESPIPEDIKIHVGVWECMLPPQKGVLFVGGYIPPEGMSCNDIHWIGEPWLYGGTKPRICLTAGDATFFGLNLELFKILIYMARHGREVARQIHPYRFDGELPSNFSLLRDGSTMAPLDFFRFREFIQF